MPSPTSILQARIDILLAPGETGSGVCLRFQSPHGMRLKQLPAEAHLFGSFLCPLLLPSLLFFSFFQILFIYLRQSVRKSTSRGQGQREMGREKQTPC